MSISLTRLWTEQDGRCHFCGRFVPLNHATRDHLMPRSRGGTDRRGNLVMACSDCNQRKRNVTDSEFGARMQRLETMRRDAEWAAKHPEQARGGHDE